MTIFELRSGSLLLKSVAIGVLALLMLWPLGQVDRLISDRQEMRDQAYQRIATSYGGAQSIGGPVLSIDVEERLVEERGRPAGSLEPVGVFGPWQSAAPRVLLAERLQIDATMRVDERRKGIYRFPTYRTRLVLSGEFSAAALTRAVTGHEKLRAQPARVLLNLPLTGLRSLVAVERFVVDGAARTPGAARLADLPVLQVPLDLSARAAQVPLPFRIELEVAGSEALRFLPLGATTRVNLRSPWPHPDFDGAYLPLTPVDPKADGFTATWQVLELNRALPQQWRLGEHTGEALLASAFGFRLLQPGEVYARTQRAVRHGVLFVAVTFLCFFAWESLSRSVQLHPLHYLLVGLALATFYLLLLAFSEHLGFDLSYAIAAAALVALIAVYVAGASGSRTGGMAIAGSLTAAYAALYTILLSEDYALLLGSLLVFGVLAILMLATRRLDWASVGRGATSQPS
jgi:inner membrane protein